MTIIYLSTGVMHQVPKNKIREVIAFYELFKVRGMWRNKRGTIYMWEEVKEK